MTAKVTLTPYDLMGKSEPEVRCVVYSRLLKLTQEKNVSLDESFVEKTFEIAGKDTLFDIVAGAYYVFVTEGVNAVSVYIEKAVSELFITKKGTDNDKCRTT